VATHDYVISNGTGSAVRSDINGALAAIVSQNSNASAPATTYAYMSWADTSAGVMKMRNGANSAWISLYELDGTFLASDISLAAGSAAAPSLFFTGDTNTGLFSPGADTVALATAGSNRLHISSGGLVGIGTTSPSTILSVIGTSQITHTFTGAPGGSSLQMGQFNTSGDASVNNTANAPLLFATNNTERARIDSSGRLLVGTSTATSVGGAAALSQIETGANIGLSVLRRSDTPIIAFGRANGSGSTIVNNGDELGTIRFAGADGLTINSYGASISCAVDGTPGANDMPGRLVFSTTADNAASPTQRLSIDNAGAFVIRSSVFFGPLTDNAVPLGGSSQRFTAVWAANGTIQTSDERAKADIANASLGSDFIKSLRPVSYKWIEGGKRDTGKRDEDNNYVYESVPGMRTHWGFIAQEVKQAVDDAGVDFGGWVLTDKDDPDSQQALRYDQFIAPLTKALQEAIAKIEALETRLSALEAA